MTEQPDKCFEHHMLLKGVLEELKNDFQCWKSNCEKIQCFFFGGMQQAQKGELSFVDKVNLLYDNQTKSRAFLMSFIGIFGTLIIGSFVALGVQLNKIDNTVNTLARVVEKQQTIEVQIAEIKAKLPK